MTARKPDVAALLAGLRADFTDLRREVSSMRVAVEALTATLRTAPVVRFARRPVAPSEAPASEPRILTMDGPPTVPPATVDLDRSVIDLAEDKY